MASQATPYGGTNQAEYAPVPVPGVIQNVAIGASSTQSAAFAAGVSFVTLNPDVNCWVVFGTNPTATSSTGIRCVADVPFTWGLERHDGTLKLAVIQEGVDTGNLNIVEGKPAT